MLVSVDDYNTCAFKVRKRFLDHTEKKRRAWLVRAPFHLLRFIDDGRYVFGDGSKERQRCNQLWEMNLCLVQTFFSDNGSKLEHYWIIAVRALLNMNIEKKLYFDHGSYYSYAESWTQ